MSGEEKSVSLLLRQLKRGDEHASSEIWRRYVGRLMPLARSKLQGLQTAAVDEEDILLSVFNRFFSAAREERFAQLENREDLWQILLVLTERRVADQFRKSHAQKRGGGRVLAIEQGESPDGTDSGYRRELIDQSPTPEFAASFADQLEVALARIGEDSSREVALLRMEGYGTREISEQMGISLSSVERKLRMIRKLWNDIIDPRADASRPGDAPDSGVQGCEGRRLPATTLFIADGRRLETAIGDRGV
jgi:DNA-directed RNA polymerase specialized sigma24 family protein